MSTRNGKYNKPGCSPISGCPPPKKHQFKKGGPPGNPNGAPKGSVIKYLRELMEQEVQPGVTGAKLLAEVARKHAAKGDFRFWQEIVNRIDGKVPDRIAGADGGPVQVTHKLSQRMQDDRMREQLLDALESMYEDR